jgi:hypothetical protein
MMTAPPRAVSVYERPVIQALPGLGDIDTCRRRLLSARSRIEEGWPKDFHRRPKELSKQAAAEVTACLKRIPSPLPMTINGSPETVLPVAPCNLFIAVGRVFDAALAVLAVDNFDVCYDGSLTVYDPTQLAAAAALGLPLKPTVGELTIKIFAEIEMISLAMGL